MYWKLLVVTLTLALVISVAPVGGPGGAPPPPVTDDTVSGSDPRPTRTGV
ncbi:uncharacterized protein EV420DRAFT_1648448 [Desarmillaria tabescens]|uniref:Uncharacterized protein n=1 Tax=Armillaria tabescens TaxID=1929756 RepID=A0AA39JP73_ARMTA|nr:uncharacterized protein EV420DRAFT_1648448 [Desarmillaria tabescens]KAK0445316.1 hypothetical protein EV420DRAFT_1648448 [Desarmillaria tabescens]